MKKLILTGLLTVMAAGSAMANTVHTTPLIHGPHYHGDVHVRVKK